ncbi:MAG: hypothetical protein FJ264_02640 [Planctomycetes bacterium]|nr:hypothetical protein [Planctomycetota bacterium]
MTSSAGNVLSELQIDAFKEIINIAFGDAAASLSEVIELHATLNVPEIKILHSKELREFINKAFGAGEDLHIVEQHYTSKFKGIAYLVFSRNSGKLFISLLEEYRDMPANMSINLLEKETLTEVGNIIIGACISKIAELLLDVVSYLPPRYIDGKYLYEDMPGNFFDGEGYAVILKTIFQFEKADITGFLFLLINMDSIGKIKEAADKFIAKYE